MQSFGEPYTSIVRAVTMVRYSLLPLWYTAFYEAYTTGQPVMRTMFSEFPDDKKTFTMDDQWLIGGSLLVKPVTGEGQTSTFIYLPISSDTDGWYDLNNLQRAPSIQGGFHNIESPLNHIPVYIRAGTLQFSISMIFSFFLPITFSMSIHFSVSSSLTLSPIPFFLLFCFLLPVFLHSIVLYLFVLYIFFRISRLFLHPPLHICTHSILLILRYYSF